MYISTICLICSVSIHRHTLLAYRSRCHGNMLSNDDSKSLRSILIAWRMILHLIIVYCIVGNIGGVVIWVFDGFQKSLQIKTPQCFKAMHHAENTTVVVKLLPTKPEGSPLLLGRRLHQQPFCDIFGLGGRNLPNLETAKCFLWQICQILCPPMFPAIRRLRAERGGL